MRKSKVKAKWARDEPAILVNLHLTDPSVYEVASLMGYDGIWMDMEHHGYSLETAQHMMRGARVGGADVMVRPAKGEFMRMDRMLESGAHGVLYPRCDNAAEAAEVVRWAKFAPLGKRGVDAAGADNPFTLGPIDTYIPEANAETFVVIQIEELSVVDRAEEIAQVEGVDALFVGAGDMSVLAGIPGQVDHPKIEKARQRVAKAARGAGKHWGTSFQSIDAVKRGLDMGARLICYGADIVAVKRWLEDKREELRPLGFRIEGEY